MPAILNVPDFVKIVAFSAIGIWMVDKALGLAGLDQYKL